MKRIDRAITSLFALGWVVCCNNPLKLTDGARVAMIQDNGHAKIVE